MPPGCHSMFVTRPKLAKNSSLPVGHAVAVRVGELVEVPVVGLEHQHRAVLERKRRARHHEAVGEHGRTVVGAVAVGVFPPRDAAVGFARIRPVGVAHIRPHLDHVEAAVGIEVDGHGPLDGRIGQDELSFEARGQQEHLLLELGRLPHHWRAPQEVGARRVGWRLRSAGRRLRRQSHGGADS